MRCKEKIKHVQYKETLLHSKQLFHGMNILRREGHEIYGVHVNKILLWIADDGIHTNAYGYKPPFKNYR